MPGFGVVAQHEAVAVAMALRHALDFAQQGAGQRHQMGLKCFL
jgi:hypothetical protein